MAQSDCDSVNSVSPHQKDTESSSKVDVEFLGGMSVLFFGEFSRLTCIVRRLTCIK